MNYFNFTQKSKSLSDIIGSYPKRKVFFNHQESILYSRGKISRCFFTEDSKLYITPTEQKLISQGKKLNRHIHRWDSLSARIVREYQILRKERKGIENKESWLVKKFNYHRDRLLKNLTQKSKELVDQWSLAELWNLSLVGAVLLGMISMSFIYRYLGTQASAENVVKKVGSGNEMVLGETTAVQQSNIILNDPTAASQENTEEAFSYIEEIISQIERQKKEEYEKEIRAMVKGYPIEDMIPYIIEKDRIVGAFLIGIAKKESNWGKRVPVLNGRDCYNYWGYKGKRKLMGTGGHTCFNSRQDAVNTVAKRLEFLINNYQLNTPEKMVIWKCGSDCEATGGWAAARKWISDVNMYFEKLND